VKHEVVSDDVWSRLITNPLRASHTLELEKWGLIERCENFSQALQCAGGITADTSSRQRWQDYRERLLVRKTDMTQERVDIFYKELEAATSQCRGIRRNSRLFTFRHCNPPPAQAPDQLRGNARKIRSEANVELLSRFSDGMTMPAASAVFCAPASNRATGLRDSHRSFARNGRP